MSTRNMFSLIALALFFQTVSGQTFYPPAPFILRTFEDNPILFRMDHVAGCPNNGLEQDVVHLHWQDAHWRPPLESRNDTTDTIRYEVSFIVDNHNGPGSITVSFPAGNAGMYSDVYLGGDELYERLFRPPVPHPVEPDTIVLRVPWFVRAWNRMGSTYSDTAGITIRENPLPTPALVMSYNRPPYRAPTMIVPLDGAVITGIRTDPWPIDVIWQDSRDRNISTGEKNAVFRVFNPLTHFWETDIYDHKVDTLTSQWVGIVVRTSPAGKGAPIGTVLARSTGTATGVQILPTDLHMLFGGLTSPPTTTTADTVVLDYRIYVKDFNTTDFTQGWPRSLKEVDFRYYEDGTLFPDTSQWSRFGCRPHELVSNTFRMTLVRDGIVGVDDGPLPPGFTLAQNHPNPFSTSTSFDYTLSEAASIRLEVCDMLGRTVKSLAVGLEAAGQHHARWDGSDNHGRRMPAGAYILRLEAGNRLRERTIMLLR